MKIHPQIIIFALLIHSIIATGQDVLINLPVSYIFNRTDFTTVHNVMNTQGNWSWRVGGKDPHIKSNSGEYFTHTSLPNTFLTSNVLQWQLASIGGGIPPFKYSDQLPGYKWFTSSYQSWYQPGLTSYYNQGNVAFRFKVPSSIAQMNAIRAGIYKINVSQDYGRSGWYIIEFSPENFNVFIQIPSEISWLISPAFINLEVSTLNDFRSITSQYLIQVGQVEIGHTEDFDLYAKSDTKEIQFTSLSGVSRKFDCSILNLSANTPKFRLLPLSKNWQNHSLASGFKVESGNRSIFQLQMSIMNEDFRRYFFEAGTYSFKLMLDARARNGNVSTQKEIDFSLNVPALSELSIIGSNEISFIFNSVQNYSEGQTKTVLKQIRLSNNSNYELYVRSNSKFFYSNGGQSSISASILEIGIENGGENITLSTEAQKILSHGVPTLDKNLDITYKISPSAAETLITKDKKSYDLSVTYSFIAL